MGEPGRDSQPPGGPQALRGQRGLDLCGRWAAAPAESGLHRDLPSRDLDDAGWETVPVPGHWREVPAFAGSDGPLLYRRRFECGPPEKGERAWLVMEGVFYQSDVWLDGSYLGDTEGYFFPHVFEVTEALGAAGEHLVAAEVACDRGGAATRGFLGAWADPACVDPDYNAGGIWAPVRLTTTGPVRIASLRAVCAEAREPLATLDISAVLDVACAATVEVVTEVRSLAGDRDGVPNADAVALTTKHLPLAAGANQARWRVEVPRPDLWWPAGLGPQPLYEISVRALIGDEESDARVLRTGLRQLRMRGMAVEVNGQRVFLQGAELVPTRRDIAAASASEVARDAVLAREAGLNLLRLKAHVARPELYGAADELGVLLWQDLPFSGPYPWAARSRAVRQAQEAVTLLGHHPSVVLWCTHAEVAVSAGAKAGLARRAPRAAGDLAGGTVADWSVRRALERADSSRPALARPGSPLLGRRSRSGPRAAGLQRVAALWPAAARFVAGLGAPSAPETGAFLSLESWPDLDWERLARHFGMDQRALLRAFPPAEFPSFAAWRDATQAHQSEVLRSAVEALRRLQFHPVGGFSVSRLNDAQPAVSCSLFDHEHRPKAAWAALARSCDPLVVVASWPAPAYLAGSDATFAVHVVNDLAGEALDLVLEARLLWPGGGRTWRFAGSAPGHRCSFVGNLRASLPGTEALHRAPGGGFGGPWAMRLDLELRRAGLAEGEASATPVAANSYDATIVAAG